MVTGLAFNRDSTLLATGGMDQRVGLWHLPNLFPKGELRKGHSGTGHTVVMFNPRTDQLISSGSDALILLWPSAGDAAEALGLVGHELPAYTLAFTQDGERLLAGDNDKKVFLWSVDPAFWRDRAYALANRDFTPDERRAYRLSAR
jgi:WD40 repeat protein